MSDYVSVCEEAARCGGDLLRSWEGRFHVREKGPSDLVTEADLASQEAIRAVISRHYPDHEFVGEEGGEHDRGTANCCWVVDPLDGTTNYVHGIPHYCVSVAVICEGQIEAGAIFHPRAGVCYTAVRDGGAYKDGRTLGTSQVTDLSGAVVAVSFPPQVGPESREVADFLAVIGNCQGVRRMGSAALNLCYLAEGRLDGYWSSSVHPWDVAAGVLIATQAGARVSNAAGGPFDPWQAEFVAAAGPQLHRHLLAKLGR
jgi:myo-inositol-1(or 4)-monophosphatase